MSQQIFDQDPETVRKQFMNVGENWKLFDTVLIGPYSSEMDFRTGYFSNYQTLGQATMVPFFNVRNRNHGLSYNNQDTRDRLPYVFKIYSIGVSFWAPSTTTYFGVNPPRGAQTTVSHLFEIEIPKHTSLSLQTNQDERLNLNVLMAPSGYGVVSGGVAQGDPEVDYTYPNVSHASFCQGAPYFSNYWGFPKPLEIPRTANLSVKLQVSEYGRNLLQAMPGPYTQPMRAVANDETFFAAPACAGIQVTLQGQRFVQQRGEHHA